MSDLTLFTPETTVKLPLTRISPAPPEREADTSPSKILVPAKVVPAVNIEPAEISLTLPVTPPETVILPVRTAPQEIIEPVVRIEPAPITPPDVVEAPEVIMVP